MFKPTSLRQYLYSHLWARSPLAFPPGYYMVIEDETGATKGLTPPPSRHCLLRFSRRTAELWSHVKGNAARSQIRAPVLFQAQAVSYGHSLPRVPVRVLHCSARIVRSPLSPRAYSTFGLSGTWYLVNCSTLSRECAMTRVYRVAPFRVPGGYTRSDPTRPQYPRVFGACG